MNIIFRHMRWPCHFVWRCTEENWDTVKDLLLKEIREKGFESFVVEKARKNPQEKESK